MNREQRRRSRSASTTAKWDEGVRGHQCPTATKIVELVQADDGNWTVDHEPCSGCGRYTLVVHLAEQVWACLACGLHGEIPGEILH